MNTIKFYQKLDQAIKNKFTISFIYDDLFRIVEPHHYGMLDGKMHLHAYQTHGESQSGDLPEWRNFNLDKISHLKMTSVHFKLRSSYNPSNSHYQNIVTQIEQP